MTSALPLTIHATIQRPFQRSFIADIFSTRSSPFVLVPTSSRGLYCGAHALQILLDSPLSVDEVASEIARYNDSNLAGFEASDGDPDLLPGHADYLCNFFSNQLGVGLQHLGVNENAYLMLGVVEIDVESLADVDNNVCAKLFLESDNLDSGDGAAEPRVLWVANTGAHWQPLVPVAEAWHRKLNGTLIEVVLQDEREEKKMKTKAGDKSRQDTGKGHRLDQQENVQEYTTQQGPSREGRPTTDTPQGNNLSLISGVDE